METVKIKVSDRDGNGTGDSRRLRATGFIPINVYGKGFERTSFIVNDREFSKAGQKSRSSQVFEFESDNAKVNGKKAIVKEIQKDAVSARILHIDFQVLGETEVNVSIPIVIVGDPIGVKTEGGVLTTACHKITCKCAPNSIPDVITVDVSALKLNSRIRTGELELPEGVRLASNPNENVANVVTSRMSRLQEEEAAAGEEAAADAPAEGAATDAPAEGAAS